MEERVPFGIQANSSDNQQERAQGHIARVERAQTSETTDEPAANGGPPTPASDIQIQLTETSPETMIVDVDIPLGSEEDPSDIHAAPELSIPPTSAQDEDASTRIIRMGQGQITNKYGQDTEWMGSAPTSQDDAVSTGPHSTSPKCTKKLRTEREGGPPRERTRRKTRNIPTQKI